MTLTASPPVEKGVAALPRIANPQDAAEARINVALARLDAVVRTASGECRKDAEGPAAADASWSRTVSVTMAGPGFLSLVIVDEPFCGGAHPDTGTQALVYDLTTGRPVDWKALLPPSMTGKIALQTGLDGTRTVSLTAPALTALFLKGYPSTEMGKDPDCRDAVKNGSDSPPAFSLWLNAKQGGLALQYDLSHVIQVCANPVVIPASVLARQGASPRLVAALEAAHRGH